jgi:NDP-sugar pyrophosphorylase family protein
MIEAIILAGGKAERLGDAARGRPKSLVDVGGKPLAAYQVALLAAAGVERIVLSCAAGKGSLFAAELGGLGPEIVPLEEVEPLGRGGGLRYAATARVGTGPILALNGDELFDVDLGSLLASHRDGGAAATITVAPLRSAFGVVEVDGEIVTGFSEAPRLPYWVNCGLYVLDDEAIARLPERGDHERTTFPELAGEGKLRAFFHEGVWLTVNTAKDLRAAEAYVTSNPDLLPVR